MNQIKELQSQLVSLGYDIKVDGVFGPDTKAALKEYTEELRDQPAPPKPALKSTAFVSGLGVLISGLLTLWGITVAPDQINLVITSIITLVTGLISIYGTITRKTPITFKSNRVPMQPLPSQNTQLINGPFGHNS